MTPTGAAGGEARRDVVGTFAVAVLTLSTLGILAAVGDAATAGVVPWHGLAIGAVATSAASLRLPLGRHVVDVTAIDAVIAVGLLAARPDELVLGVVLGVVAHLTLVRRHRGVVLLVNVAGLAAHLAVAVVLSGVLDGVAAVAGFPALHVVLSATAGAVAASSVVAVASVLGDGVEVVGDVPLAVALGVVASAGSATGGAIAAVALLDARALWWTPLLLLATAFGSAVLYLRERRRSTALAAALESARQVHATADPGRAQRLLLEALADRFAADAVEIVRIGAEGERLSRDAWGASSLSGLFAGMRTSGRGARLHGVHRLGSERRGHGMSIRVPVDAGDDIELRVARSAERSPYHRRDLAVFAAFGEAAARSLETSRMNETLRRLQQLDEMKTAFLTAVSHDLRTPLAVVLAGVGTLETHDERLSGEQRRLLLRRITAQGSRLDRMLSDLLDIDRLERGVIEPQRRPTDLSLTAAEVVEGLTDPNHPVRVSRDEVVALVDPGHVSRIVENLVRNAFKYTPPGTPVWVDARRDATGAQLIVSDAGPGVPEEQRAAIFEPFVRGDDAHPSPGTGVGLDLVRRLAELHGGAAWVDERPGGGARFWVTLPDPAAIAPTGSADPAHVDDADRHGMDRTRRQLTG